MDRNIHTIFSQSHKMEVSDFDIALHKLLTEGPGSSQPHQTVDREIRGIGGSRTPRLMAACKEFNIGKEKLVEVLVEKGYDKTVLKPTAKLSVEMYVDLIQVFDPDRLEKVNRVNNILHARESDEITIGLNLDGKLIVFETKIDGTIVWATGLTARNGLFLPVFNNYSEVLKEFEELINYPRVTENELQKFLERNPEFLQEDDYQMAVPQARIVTAEHTWNADFVLVPKNQIDFCRIIELKLPREKIILREKNGHPCFSKNLLQAIQQLRDYSKATLSMDTRKKFKAQYGTDIYRPDLQLIIGRKGGYQMLESFIDKQRDSGVKITDWNTFYEKCRNRFT